MKSAVLSAVLIICGFGVYSMAQVCEDGFCTMPEPSEPQVSYRTVSSPTVSYRTVSSSVSYSSTGSSAVSVRTPVRTIVRARPVRRVLSRLFCK